MEKEIQRFLIEYTLNWEWGVEIKQIREDLDAIEKLGATHVQIESGIAWDSSYITFEAISERMETDYEFKARVDEIKNRKAQQEKHELEQLAKLKSKYEK